MDGAYAVPNSTLFSSQEGPDWIVTVGAVAPGPHNFYGPLPGQSAFGAYQGAGKPVGIAGIGQDYPTAYGSAAIGGTGSSGFGGTPNATPQVAGYYARGLYKARRELRGPSRVQHDGVVARGDFSCGALRRECELGDGELTTAELRTRLFHGASSSYAGTTTPLALGTVPHIGEERFMAQGHGYHAGRESRARNEWLSEFARFFDPLIGGRAAAPLPGRTTLKSSCPGGKTPLNRRR